MREEIIAEYKRLVDGLDDGAFGDEDVFAENLRRIGELASMMREGYEALLKTSRFFKEGQNLFEVPPAPKVSVDDHGARLFSVPVLSCISIHSGLDLYGTQESSLHFTPAPHEGIYSTWHPESVVAITEGEYLEAVALCESVKASIEEFNKKYKP